ncbi:MAG: hypothetical protein JW797_09410 [Bradymonadales bacterium]|nr:hypothetical protein [Bradymonadales bacterium]
MSKKTDNPIGLFRLEDLEGIEVESETLFGGQKKAQPTGFSATTTGDQMVDLIRRARGVHPPPPAPSDQAVEAEPVEPTPAPVVPQAAADSPPEPVQAVTPVLTVPSGAGKFDTSEIRAVIRAAEKEVSRRSKLRGMLWLAILLPLLVGSLAVALALVLTRPPPMLQASYPVQQPALSVEGSDLATVEVSLIPQLDPEAPVEPESPPPTRSRRSRSRSRDPRPAVDPRNLF